MDLLSSLGIRIPCATPIMVSTCGIVHGYLIHSKLYLIYALQTASACCFANQDKRSLTIYTYIEIKIPKRVMNRHKNPMNRHINSLQVAPHEFLHHSYNFLFSISKI